MQASAAAYAAPSDTAEKSAPFKAPLLHRILDHGEDPGPRIVALDLGPPNQAVLDRIGANRPCRVEIADLAASGGIEILGNTDLLDEHGPSLVSSLLPPPGRDPLELILCWDLPNYLSTAALKILFDALGHRAAPGCKLHMLIAYSKRDMASRPARYAPAEDGTLAQICIGGELSRAPRYSPEDLGRAVGHFAYERGVLLANGMQEFVYAWPGDPDAERPF